MARPRRLPLISAPTESVTSSVPQPTAAAKTDRKLVAVTLSPVAAKHLRLFKAYNDWTNEQMIEAAILTLHRQYPTYEVH